MKGNKIKMKKRKSLFILIVIISFILVITISIYKNMKVNENNKNNDMEEELVKIKELEDNQKIYIEKDTDIYLLSENILLSDALINKQISLEWLFSKMKLENIYYDGGSSVYISNSQDFSQIFYVAKCSNVNGNKNIYISKQQPIKYCSKKA